MRHHRGLCIPDKIKIVYVVLAYCWLLFHSVEGAREDMHRKHRYEQEPEGLEYCRPERDYHVILYYPAETVPTLIMDEKLLQSGARNEDWTEHIRVVRDVSRHEFDEL